MPNLNASGMGSLDDDLGSIAGSVVHEVKNPLSTLRINTQLLLEEWEDPQSPKEHRVVKRLGVMLHEIDRIDQIFNSFLRFTQNRELNLIECDLNAMVSDLMDRNAEGWFRQNIRARIHTDPDLKKILIDESLVQQALLNLLRNAEQAMPEEGELIVQTRLMAEHAEIEVVDTGVGMDEQRLSRIFRPYFSSKAEGTGLGLPTTQRIIRSHGGKLIVESELGKGSRFIIELPLVDQTSELSEEIS